MEYLQLLSTTCFPLFYSYFSWGSFGSRYLRIDQVKFVEGRPYHFKGCLPQILLGPFLNTLTHLRYPFTTFVEFRNEVCYIGVTDDVVNSNYKNSNYLPAAPQTIEYSSLGPSTAFICGFIWVYKRGLKLLVTRKQPFENYDWNVKML